LADTHAEHSIEDDAVERLDGAEELIGVGEDATTIAALQHQWIVQRHTTRQACRRRQMARRFEFGGSFLL
jgi:hypothetical protein